MSVQKQVVKKPSTSKARQARRNQSNMLFKKAILEFKKQENASENENLIRETIMGIKPVIKVEPEWPGLIPIDDDSLPKAICWSKFLGKRDQNSRKVNLSLDNMVLEMKRKYDILQPLTKMRSPVSITQTPDIICYGRDLIVENYVHDHFKKALSGNQMREIFCRTEIEYGLFVQDIEKTSLLVPVDWLVRNGKWIVDKSRGDSTRGIQVNGNNNVDGKRGGNGVVEVVVDRNKAAGGLSEMDVDEDGLDLTCAMDNF